MKNSPWWIAVLRPFCGVLKPVDISLPEKTTKPLQKYMQMMFERPGFRASLTEAELEMRE